MRSPLARHSWTSDFPLWRLQSFAPACAQRPWRPIAPQMDGVISLRKRLLPLAEGRGARPERKMGDGEASISKGEMSLLLGEKGVPTPI